METSCPSITYSYYLSVFSGNLINKTEASECFEFILMLMVILLKLLRYFSDQPLQAMSGNAFQSIFIKVPVFIWALKMILLKGPALSLHSAHCFKLCSSVGLRSLTGDLKSCALRTDIWHRISFLFGKLTARNLTQWAKLPSANEGRKYVKGALLSKLHSSWVSVLLGK